MNEDAVVACVHLVERAGAREFELGYLHDDVPVEEAGWWAAAHYQGARISVGERRSPSEAAMALAERLLWKATCRCRKPVALSGEDPGRCRWRLMGPRWEPGCDDPPIPVKGAQRGDHAAITRALLEQAPPANRAGRRARERGR
jgi:hypothetical protein